MQSQKLHKLLPVTIAYRYSLLSDNNAHAFYLLYLFDVDNPRAMHLQETGREFLFYLGH